MVVYTKGRKQSFDNVHTLSNIALRPCFVFDIERMPLARIGVSPDCDAIELINAIEAMSPLGYVIRENTPVGDLFDSKTGVAGGGCVIVTKHYSAIVYIGGTTYTVYKDEGYNLEHKFELLLPTNCLSTYASTFIGSPCQSYTFVDGGIMEYYPTQQCTRLPECTYAFAEGSRLKAVFGCRIGTLSWDYEPTTSIGARLSLMAKRRTRVTPQSLSDKQGVLISKSTARERIERFRSGLSVSFSEKIYELPPSLAYSISAALSFALFNTKDARERWSARQVMFIYAADKSIGDGVTDFINTGADAAPFIYGPSSALGGVLEANASVYKQLLLEQVKTLRTMTNSVLVEAMETVVSVLSEMEEKVRTDCNLAAVPLLANPFSLATTETDDLKEWQQSATEELGKVGGCLEVSYPEMGEDGKPTGKTIKEPLSVKNASKAEQVHFSKELCKDLLGKSEGGVYYRAGAIGALQKLRKEIDEIFAPMLPETGSDLFDSTDTVYDGSSVADEEHQCHSCGHHCEDFMSNIDPFKEGLSGDDESYGTPALPAISFSSYFSAENCPDIVDGKLTRGGYHMIKSAKIDSVFVSRPKVTYNKSEDGTLTSTTLRFPVKVTWSFVPLQVMGYKLRSKITSLMTTFIRNIAQDRMGSHITDVKKTITFNRMSPLAGDVYGYTYASAHGYGCLRGQQYAMANVLATNPDVKDLRFTPGVRLHYDFNFEIETEFTPVDLSKENSGVSELTSGLGKKALSLAASGAANDLVKRLSDLGILGDGQFVFDIGNSHSDFFFVDIAQALTSVKLDLEVVKGLILQLWKCREEKNRSTGAYVFDDMQRAAIDTNIGALAHAAYYNISALTGAPSATAVSNAMTPFATDPQQVWYVDSCESCAVSANKPDFVAYCGALS